MRSPTFVPGLLFLLSSVPLIYGQSFSSYSNWLNSVPSCARDCLDQAFGKVVKSCNMEPDSTAQKDIKCFCSGGGISVSEQFDDGVEAGKCAVRVCESGQVSDITQDLLDVTTWCTDVISGSTGSSSGSSSSSSSSSSGSSSSSSGSSGSGSSGSGSSGSGSSGSGSSGSGSILSPTSALFSSVSAALGLVFVAGLI
jgi:cobalamin biosynthesis Mg chelatase CobN